MSSITETFIKGSDNQIVLKLTENGVGIAGAWSSLSIFIGYPTAIVTITRTADGNGVALNTSTGDLTLTPGKLTESLAALIGGSLHRVWVKVVSTANPNGVDFGANDSDAKLYFEVQDRPA